MPAPVHLTTPHSYSAAVVAGDCVFLGLHRGAGETFPEQLASALSRVTDTLDTFDLPLTSLVKVTVWLLRIEDLPVMEKIFVDYFPVDRYPARMTATTQFIDADCLVMIEGIAYRG
ncbi:MAG: RidA family protein [Anaerolineae bacterium]